MTDMINSLLVIFEKDIREDDVEAIVDAVKMIKGVISVTKNTSSFENEIAEARALQYYREKLWDILFPK